MNAKQWFSALFLMTEARSLSISSNSAPKDTVNSDLKPDSEFT